MSLTSYRAAPPRDTVFAHVVGVCLGTRGLIREKGRMGPFARGLSALTCEWVFLCPPALMPGDALLFQRLSGSTIGAVRFHGRVRDGIGWVTDAMVTKQ